MSISIPTVSHRDGGAVIPQGPNVASGVLTGVKTPGVKDVPQFRDFGKNVTTVLTRSFPDTYKVELITAQDNGLKFQFSGEKRHDKVTNVDSIFVSSNVRFEKGSALKGADNKGVVVFSGTIDSEKLEGELSFDKVGSSGVKAIFKGKFLDNNKTEASAELQYNAYPASGSVGLFLGKDDKIRTELQGSANVYKSLTLGALASYYLPSGVQGEGSLDNYQIGATYATGSLPTVGTSVVERLTLSGILKAARNPKAGNELSYTAISRVFYNHDKDTKFAADVTHPLGKSFNEVEVKLYGERSFDTNTIGKVGFERSGNVRFAVEHKLNPNFKLTVGAQFNALRVEEHTVGVHANFTA